MTKPIIPLAIATSAIFILSACGSTTQAITTNTETATESTPDAQGNAQPQTQSDIQWTVKSIVGNEFTIETIDMSNSETMKQMQDPEFRTKMQTMSETERQEMMTKMQEERANAKRTIVEVTIPVGTPVLIRSGFWGGFGGGARTGGQGGPWANAGGAGLGASLGGSTAQAPTGQTAPTQKQGTITDIKVWSTVTIWLDKTVGDRKIAAWTSVSTAPAGVGGGFGGGQSGGQPPAGAMMIR